MAFPEPHNKEGVESGLEPGSLNPGAPASVVRELDGAWEVLSKTWQVCIFTKGSLAASRILNWVTARRGGESREVGHH